MSLTTPINATSNQQEFTVVKRLSKARFPVYLAKSTTSEKSFALKVYPFEEGKVSKFFLNECHFIDLNHPNIITIYQTQKEKNSVSKGKQSKISYILMEYAPYGDFYDLIITKRIQFDEKLVRTYFHQLIQGLEYLHNRGFAHMDIKPDNILLSEDFELKITDFDLSYYEGDDFLTGRGTPCYRAPELVVESNCPFPQKADIYAAGIFLFVLKTGGKLPHSENILYQDVNLSTLMYEDSQKFWKMHCEINDKPSSFFDDDFKALFSIMTKFNPQERASIAEIKKSKWYNGPIYSKEELKSIMKKKIHMT